MTNPEEELVKLKFISSLRVLEINLRLLDGIKAKPTLTRSKRTESKVQQSSNGFSGSSTGNKPVIVKEEMRYHFKKTFKKLTEKFTGEKGNGHLCNRCGGKPHNSKPCPALNKKFNACEKVGHFAKMCKSKTQPSSGLSDQHNYFCEQEGRFCGQTSSEKKLGMYYTRKIVFKMSATW